MPTTHSFKISKHILPITKQNGGIMNNLGDTSFNKRNLLKQGLGVNLYPLPFAKGGSLPKAQKGAKMNKAKYHAQVLSKQNPKGVTRGDLRAYVGDTAAENLAEGALGFIPGPAAQAARLALRGNDLGYAFRTKDEDGQSLALQNAPGIIAGSLTPGGGLYAKNAVMPIVGRLAEGFSGGADVLQRASGDRPSLSNQPFLSAPFLPDRRRSELGTSPRMIKRELKNMDKYTGFMGLGRVFKKDGGSMPGYQGGGAMPELNSQMLDEVSVMSGSNPMNDSNSVPVAPINQYNGSGLGRMPRVPFGMPSSSPAVRSGVPVPPAPSAPRVQNISSGPRNTGGGYRYGASFGQGRPASGSITRRPNVRTRFQ